MPRGLVLFRRAPAGTCLDAFGVVPAVDVGDSALFASSRVRQDRRWTSSVLRVDDAGVPDRDPTLEEIQRSLIQGTDDLHQMSVHYPASGLNDDHLGSHLLNRRTPRAGDRAPDAPVVDEHGTTTLFAHTTNPDGYTWGWSLLAFDGGKEDPRGHRAAAVAAVRAWASVRPRLISASSAGSDPAALAVDLADLDQRAHAAYGLRGRPALVLVRPDGHIAYRGAVNRSELLRSYCTRIFGPPATGAA